MEQIRPKDRYILAQEEDLNLNISLKNNFNDLNEFNNTRVLSLSELFTKERNESTKYRIYGNINFISFLRNKKVNPSDITDMFNDDYLINGFNFEDFFDLKILRLTSIQSYQNNTNTFIEQLTAVTDTNDYNLNFFGYGRNIYNEKIYNFKFDYKNFNPSDLVKIGNDFIYDNNIYLGFIPRQSTYYSLYEKVIESDYINELDTGTTYGYSQTAFTSNTNQIVTLVNYNSNFSDSEFKNYFVDKLQNFLKIYNLNVSINNLTKNIRFIRNYIDIGNSDYKTKVPLNITNINIFTGNSISFDKENYNFSEIIKKEYLIKLQLIDIYQGPSNEYNVWKNNKNYTSYTYTETNTSPNGAFQFELKIDFWFKFNPFYKIELKKYDSVLDEIYTGITTNLIPPQTAIIDNDRIIWKDLLLYGDPDNYDNPFVNNTHYFFNDINFYLKPDLSDRNTFILINEFLLNYDNNNYKFNRKNINLVPEIPKDIC
jgi:hypothetical protein